jgi:PhoPQ-activated pathogenicity-related protein
MAYLNTPPFDALAELIDPINFNARFEEKPAYIIVASQDEFFQPDSANFFFQDLLGEKYLRVLPGADHAFSSTFNVTDVLVSIDSFFHMIVDNIASPTGLHWNLVKTASRNGNAAIVAVSNISPRKVVMYSTNTISTTQRDFRLFACYTASGYGCYQGLTWNATVIAPTNNAYYVASRKAPAAGWGLFFLEFTYEIGGSEFKVTSEVNIVPDTLPFASCGTSCGSVSLANP